MKQHGHDYFYDAWKDVMKKVAKESGERTIAWQRALKKNTNSQNNKK